MGTSARRRKIFTIALGFVLLVLFSGFTALNAFRMNFLNPATLGQIVVFTGLSALAFLIFVAVLVLLVRNVLKLYADQRSRVMGTRLRTRMLWGAVLVSLIPIAFMFVFSYGLMNRAVDRWFSPDVNGMRDDSNSMALKLAQYSSANARAEAESIAASLPSAHTLLGKTSARKTGDGAIGGRQTVTAGHVLSQHQITLQNGFAVVYRAGHSTAAFNMPKRGFAAAEVKPWIPEPTASEDETDSESKAAGSAPAETIHAAGDMDAAILTAAQRNDLPIFSIGDTDYALGTAAVKEGGTVVVGLPMPYGMSATMTRLRKATEVYWSVYRSRRQVRTLYMLLLMMMTSLALFASSWLALHLSKQVTKPVEALADAMEAIAAVFGTWQTKLLDCFSQV